MNPSFFMGAVTFAIAIIGQAVLIGIAYGGLRAEMKALTDSVKSLIGLPALDREVSTVKDITSTTTARLLSLTDEVSDMRARLTIVEKTKASRDDLPAVRPGSRPDWNT